jgi:hypothetical protein
LREHRGARRATEGTEQRRADVLRGFALKLDAFAFGVIELTSSD